MVTSDVGAEQPPLREVDVRSAAEPSERRALRRQLVGAAVGLFVKQGYHETTTRDIARAAGWSVGALYEFVKSKGDILYHVCEEIHEETESLLSTLPEGPCPADKALCTAMETFMRACDTKQDVIVLIYQESNCLSPELLALVMQSEERITTSFLALIRRGMREGVFTLGEDKEARLMAHNIVVLGQMWAFRRWYFRKHFTLEEYIAVQCRHILRNLAPTSSWDGREGE